VNKKYWASQTQFFENQLNCCKLWNVEEIILLLILGDRMHFLPLADPNPTENLGYV
jgi:hypothetical protein